MKKVSTEELKEMRDTLAQEEIDDPEEILMWFGVNGVAMIDELLKLREDAMYFEGSEFMETLGL